MVIREGFGKEINTRRFNGRTYRLYDISHSHKAALQTAARLRKKGYRARAVAHRDRWLVYYDFPVTLEK